MLSWPDVALAVALLAAIVALHVLVPDDANARSTILVLIGITGPWLASFRQQRQMAELKAQVQRVQDDVSH